MRLLPLGAVLGNGRLWGRGHLGREPRLLLPADAPRTTGNRPPLEGAGLGTLLQIALDRTDAHPKEAGSFSLGPTLVHRPHHAFAKVARIRTHAPLGPQFAYLA